MEAPRHIRQVHYPQEETLDPPCSWCGRRKMTFRTMEQILNIELSFSADFKRYGLLENCFHVFCLECIRCIARDRITMTQKKRGCWKPIYCPACYSSSSCIVASEPFITNFDDKAVSFQAFKANVLSLPCPYLRIGLGWCLCEKRNHENYYSTSLKLIMKQNDDPPKS